MNTLTRINPMGHKYMLVRQAGDKTLVITGTKQITMDITLEDMSQCWYNWQMSGQHAQVAFPTLSAEHREFLITGITPAEWKEIFKDGED